MKTEELDSKLWNGGDDDDDDSESENEVSTNPFFDFLSASSSS